MSSSAFPLLDILIKLLLESQEPESVRGFATFSLVPLLPSLFVLLEGGCWGPTFSQSD